MVEIKNINAKEQINLTEDSGHTTIFYYRRKRTRTEIVSTKSQRDDSYCIGN